MILADQKSLDDKFQFRCAGNNAIVRISNKFAIFITVSTFGYVNSLALAIDWPTRPDV
jgi:hypothetical protein